MYGRLDDLRTGAERVRQGLETARTSLSARRDGMRMFAEGRSAKYEAKRSQQHNDADFMAAEKVEAKLRTVEASIFSMDEFIATREREANVEPMVRDLEGVLTALNQSIISNA